MSVECGYNLSKTISRTLLFLTLLLIQVPITAMQNCNITINNRTVYYTDKLFSGIVDTVFTKLHGLHLPIIHGAMYTCEAETATYKVVVFKLA
jgi:hypothetical protein